MIKNRSIHLKKNLFSTLLLGLVIFSGCMHKSPMKGVSDDIHKAVICTDPAGDCLVTMETLFQASSKSSENGITYISGYEDLRLSSYDMEDGRLLARHVYGRRNKRGAVLLGHSLGTVWLYSCDPELGLHARNARTLDPVATEQRILEINSSLKGELSRPEWNSTDRFYAFDPLQDRVILTDTQGARYALDPVSLNTRKLPASFQISSLDPHDSFKSTYLQYQGHRLGLTGEMRKTMEFDSRPIGADESFLEGSFIRDLNRVRIIARIRFLYQRVSREIAEAERRLAEDPKNREYRQALYNVERIGKEAEKALERIEKEQRFDISPQLLCTEEDSFFVVHRASTAKDARLRLSHLRLKENQELQNLWTVTLENLFFDINNARETSSFKQVFSKGDPRFDFSFFDITPKRVVFISMLTAYGLDLETGKILWTFRF